MKLLAISDPHHKVYDPYGIEQLKYNLLSQVLAYWGPKVDYIIHLADDNDSAIFSSGVVTRQAETWSVLGEDIKKVFVLKGNHDEDEKKYIPLMPFAVGTGVQKKGMTIVGREPVKMGDVVMQGFTGKLPPLVEGGEYFFGHLAIDYEAVGWGGMRIEEYLQNTNYKISFFGDIHKPYDLERIVSVGTMFPSTFRDEGLEGQYLIIDIDGTCTYERYVLDYPRFVTLDVYEDTNLDELKTRAQGNVCRVKVHAESTPEQRDFLYQELLLGEPHYLGRPVPVRNHNGHAQTALSVPGENLAETIARYSKARSWPGPVAEFANRFISRPILER